MSGFDHDAAMQRGAERQQLVEKELHTLFELMENSTAPAPAKDLFLVFELLKLLHGDEWKMPNSTIRDEQRYSAIPAAASVARRHLARHAKSSEEYNHMLLDLAKKMLDNATSRVTSNFGMWESQTFREGAKEIVSPPAALRKEYWRYIEGLRRPWFAANRSRSKDVFEVMSKRDRAEVHDIMARWEQYISPLAEAWWKEHGYGIVWPDDNTKPEQYYKLEAA